MHWRQNPQRVAWIVLTANFVACMMLAVAGPLAARAFVLHATRSLPSQVTTTAGTVQVKVPGASEPNAVPERRKVPEGSQITTDTLAQALVTVSADDAGQNVLATVRLFQDTSLRLEQIRTPRFRWSEDSNSLIFVLERGRVRIATTAGNGRPVQVRLDTPHASSEFGEGTFDIVMRDQETQVTALLGSADVQASGANVVASSGQRIIVPIGRAPGLPVPAEQNLIRNGTFEEELLPAWQEVVEIGPGHQPGQISRENSGRRAIRFTRSAEDGVPNSIGIRQVIDQDVQGHDSLVLQFDLQLLNHSVPGGGMLNSEYPLKVDIFYRDIYGKDLHWFEGFYSHDLPPGSNWQQPTGIRVPLGVWYRYESPNLFETLRDTRPAHIYAVTISANGHDYDSLLSDAALIMR